MKEVIKKWGKEVWIANEPEYCGKLLYVDKGASGSLHYHPGKKETFYLWKGRLDLELMDGDLGDGVTFHLVPDYIYPVTVQPHTPHRFTAIEDSIIFEVSTHHDDEDVVRLEPSRSSYE